MSLSHSYAFGCPPAVRLSPQPQVLLATSLRRRRPMMTARQIGEPPANSNAPASRQDPVPQPKTISTSLASSRDRNTALRVRQHVNPLAGYFQRPVETDGWMDSAFENPDLPLVIDVGCAKGRWVKQMAESDKTRNYVGLEIRSELVAAGNGVRDRDNLSNLHYMYCNANVSFGKIAAPATGRVSMVCFQFCDPWFKARHAKRRVVQERLVRQVRDVLAATKGQCYVVSDVRALAEEMRDRFDSCQGMVRDDRYDYNEEGWLVENPFGVQTEREISVLRRPGLSVYGTMFRVD